MSKAMQAERKMWSKIYTYDVWMEGQGIPVYRGYYIEDLTEGMTAVFGKTITDADILMFAGVSGDTNPVHLNEEFALGTAFHGRIAHGHARDLRGRCEVTIEQRRLHRQRISIGVEAVGLGVGWQHRRRLDLHRQQIANRVGVLGTIEPMHERTSRARRRFRSAIEHAFEVGDERFPGCGVPLPRARL